MFKILAKKQLGPDLWSYHFHAPQIAAKRRAGQFIILQVEHEGERIPLTIAAANPEEGWIEIIFKAIGVSTRQLAQLEVGATIPDLVGPLGRPTHIEKFGRCVCVGGGVGIAPLYPIVKALVAAGNEVTTIIGARDSSLLFLTEEMAALSHRIFVVTDDGSSGTKGFVSDPLKELLAAGEQFAYAMVIGPPIMMKTTAAITLAAGITTYVSLNPIMVDGTGMCGGCRVNIAGKAYFACVDGPEFNAQGVDWDTLEHRLANYNRSDSPAAAPKADSAAHECHLEKHIAASAAPAPTTASAAPAAPATPPKGKTKRTPLPEQSPQERAQNFAEVVLGYSAAEAQQEARRCLQCKQKPCVAGCPIGVQIPEFLKLIAAGDFIAAGLKIKESHLFPSICGRVCPQELQCEAKCTLGKTGNPLAIGALERFVGDLLCKELPPEKKSIPAAQPKKIAVIGTGPSGLTVASEMIQHGFKVTMFEALHEIGGVLAYGIPDFRLPKEILQTELVQLKQYGVEVVTNFVIGKTATVDELLQEWKFDAVFIGSGAGLPLFMGIPGEYNSGVYSANEYLTRINLMRAHIPGHETRIIRGKTVVVGGGNIAMDAARVALRLGAETALVYRRGEAEMPARKEEVRHAKEEGIEFHLLTNPVEILGDATGMVTGIRCVRMEYAASAENSGRRNVVPVPGSEFTMDCAVVVMAIGNRSNPLIQESTQDLQTTTKGTIVSQADDGRTSKKFVYVGGDVLTGAATVISAIATGKRASRSIIEDLEAAK